MEATLQRNKPKSHRSKSKHSSDAKSLEVDSKQKILNHATKKNEENLLQKKMQDKDAVHFDVPKNMPPLSSEKNPPVESDSTKILENNTTTQNIKPLVNNTPEQHESSCEMPDSICINPEKAVEASVKPAINLYAQCSEKLSEVQYSAVDVTESEACVLKSQQTFDIKEQTKLQQVYPDLKYCEQLNNIECSQTLVKTYTGDYQMKTVIEANKSYEEFVKVTHQLQKEPLQEMIHQYFRAKKSCIQLRSRMKYLKSDVKRKKDSLWKSVKKDVSAKGKCDDGSCVKITHSFLIKELDQNKFNEVIKNLKEIEESMSSDAFNSYLEELMKLRIEHFLHGLVEDGKSESIESYVDDEYTEEDNISLKKCISVLFDCQRQNVQDKSYIETCQEWLKTLVSKLLKYGKFQDNLLIMNHVLRCPNGIQSWASQFIQVPFSECANDQNAKFDCICSQQILLALYLLLNPVPLKEIFLKSIKESSSADSVDGNFAILDSEGEEEEMYEISKNWSDTDIVSLLNQIPVRSLYKHVLLGQTTNTDESPVRVQSEESMLKMFAYSTAVVDVLFKGLETYGTESYPKFFEAVCNLVRHILSYISDYWIHQENICSKPQIQAVYDRFIFHIIFKIITFEKLNSWRILSSLPYQHISKKMFWNILWIFFCPGRSEDEIYAEKDVERKIKDESAQCMFVSYIENFSCQSILHLLNALETISKSSSDEEDFLTFLIHLLFKITFIEPSLKENLMKEGIVIISSVLTLYPHLISELLKKIDESEEEVINCSISLFKGMNISNWIPEDSDINVLSCWLLSNPLPATKSRLARLIFKNLNWDFNKEGSLFLPYLLHRRIALLVSEAYLKFVPCINEQLVSWGVKQMLQFASVGGYQRDEDEFVHWAWNLLFYLKLHPLDRKSPNWVHIYDGYIDNCDKPNITGDSFFEPVLLSAYEKRHPSGCYLMIVMTNKENNMKHLMETGLSCLSSLVENKQYMAAIKSLYYVLPFFVKNSEQLLEQFSFMKVMSDLITADMTVMSNITGEPVIGAVLHTIAAMMKYQIDQAIKSTVECATPLLKLWIKILMKIFSLMDNSGANNIKSSAKQIYFLLDILVKMSYIHCYMRDCALDLLSSYCNPLLLSNTTQTSSKPFWRRMFSYNSPMNAILKRNVIPEYPWLAWFVLSSEMKQKNVQDLWSKMQSEMVKQNDSSPSSCLKKVSDDLKIDQPPIESLPIYRWAHQATKVSMSHPISPLLWQQFFIYFFHRIHLPNSQHYLSIGMKYFKHGPHVALLKQIKEHLADGAKSYRSTFKIPDSHCLPVVDSDEINKCDAELAFHLNVLKIFQAFHLWIDDESLHESNLCLSTLEPKYCPDRLELVLTGNQNVWYDLISNTCVKEEVDQKVHSWLDKKSPDVIHKQSVSVNGESLPQQLSRHIGSYENIESVSNDASISTVVPEINNTALSSSDILVHLIENNQCVIFDKAKYFSEQMKKLKQLNFNFINWVPQEYKIEDSELSEMKLCHKGNGANGCSGAALFRLQIQKCTRNARISDRIYNNRSDYLILQDQVSKLPVKDICIATLHIENFIRSLAKRMRMSEKEEKERLRNMGIALFYHQVNAIDKIISSVVEYSPSLQFFSSIIESLGEEFIEGADSELLNLAKAILNHPEAGKHALPLFNPNKSCVRDFQSVYEALTLAVGKYSPSTLFALFSKIDFSIWLKESSPHFDSRREVFRYTCIALLSCGFTPSSELLPVFEILKRHFSTILSYMFPELFQDAVVFLLNGIENNNLSVDVFYKTFYCFGCPLFNNETSVEDIEKALQKFAQNQQLPANQQIFISVVRMNLKQVQHAANNFYYHFMKKRSSCQLYKNHALYIKPLGIFLAIISHSIVALHFDEISSHSKTSSISNLWEEFHLPFKPWIHPSESASGLSFPWSEEVDKAHFMFKIFISSVKYFHEQVSSHECEESVLSYLWNCYVQIYVVPGHRHYSTSVCHSEMMNLPWHQFHPSAYDIEGMCKVLQSSLHENKEFLSKISLKIPWSDVMKSISLTKSPEYVAKVLVTLGKLLIISQFSCAETDCNLYPSIFKELESLSWHFLSVADTAGLLELYYTNSDPLLLLDNLQRNSDIHILQFLKLVCCLVPNSNADECSNDKRILYLQKFVTALSALVASNGAHLLKSINKFKVLLPSLLDEVDTAIRNGVEPGMQVNYALPLVKETLFFLNTLPGGELETAALNSVRSWLSANTQSPLLLSCLKVSSQGLSVSHMVSLSECCISARFSSEILDAKTREVWQLISSFFHVPSSSSEEFIQKCVEENAYLTLYCYTLHKLPHSASRESKKALLVRAVQWIRESNLSTYAEAKFLLLWDIILKLSISLVSLEESQVVKQELVSFCWELENLAKDRSDSGFFATIGFGQASSLSVNFRFLCRVMSAFILYQIPDNCPIRLDPMDSHHLFSACDGNKTGGSKSNQEPSFSRSALKAMENLKALLQKKLYTALQSQVDYAITCILDPTYNLSESRKLLKYFSVALYPKESYLSALDS